MYPEQSYLVKERNLNLLPSRGAWLAEWVKYATLGLRVMSSSPTLGEKPTYSLTYIYK